MRLSNDDIILILWWNNNVTFIKINEKFSCVCVPPLSLVVDVNNRVTNLYNSGLRLD